MSHTLTPTQIMDLGTRIGRAIARDVMGDPDMPRAWTGLDAQDGDQLLAAGLAVDTPEWTAAEAAARAAYLAAVGAITLGQVAADAARRGSESMTTSRERDILERSSIMSDTQTRTIVEHDGYRLVKEIYSGEQRIEHGADCSEWLDADTCDEIVADPSLMAGMRVDEPIDDADDEAERVEDEAQTLARRTLEGRDLAAATYQDAGYATAAEAAEVLVDCSDHAVRARAIEIVAAQLLREV